MKLPVLKETKERPVLNSSFIPSKTFGEPRSMNLDTLIYWVKRTPECIGILKRIATDIVTEMSFVSTASQLTGRPNKSLHQKVEDKAIAFWRINHGRQKLIAAVLDWLMTGDSYIWKGVISDAQIREVATRHLNDYGMEIDKSEIDINKFKDEDFNRTSAIEMVPSSMVTIEHDDHRILEYIQKSKTSPDNDIRWTPDKIIHAKFLEIDGKVYGYSPMESSFIAIKTINAIQDYNYNYFANKAKIDRAWLFMGNPSQDYLDKHEESLKEYKTVTHSHGDLIVAGADNIEVKDLNAISEEMEFRKTAINAVGRLAFAFNMPADILSSILGVDVKGTAMGSDLEDSGYNMNIIEAQKYWEGLLNTQLFNEFKVECTLERKFRQDQIRQIQYQTTTVPFVEFLFKHEYPVTDEYIHSLLQIDRKYFTDGKIKREVEETIPFKPPADSKGQNQQKLSDTKKAQQKPQANIQPQVGS